MIGVLDEFDESCNRGLVNFLSCWGIRLSKNNGFFGSLTNYISIYIVPLSLLPSPFLGESESRSRAMLCHGAKDRGLDRKLVEKPSRRRGRWHGSRVTDEANFEVISNLI